MNSKN
jgi:hypothetical protein